MMGKAHALASLVVSKVSFFSERLIRYPYFVIMSNVESDKICLFTTGDLEYV